MALASCLNNPHSKAVPLLWYNAASPTMDCSRVTPVDYNRNHFGLTQALHWQGPGPATVSCSTCETQTPA